jgi:hormone-sensitive lipase
VLLLYEGKLQIKDQQHQKYSCSCCDVIPDEDLETIIVYIHGGGFIALSSSTMQTYTRKWANELHVPIFCIDYRKPPEFRFPTAVHDCVAVYEFITNHIHRYFNIRPRKIILAGDSAGGNLACSLEAIILKTGLHPPAGMYLAYPAVDTRKQYSPSRLNAFHDAILLPKLLLLCLH